MHRRAQRATACELATCVHGRHRWGDSRPAATLAAQKLASLARMAEARVGEARLGLRLVRALRLWSPSAALLEVARDEVLPWCLGDGDPVKERVRETQGGLPLPG